MSELADKLAEMDRFLSILTELQHDKKRMIERLARFQGEADAAGFKDLAAKFGDAWSSASLTFTKLDTVHSDFQVV
ncbi:MAG: hypothetical protein Q8J74_02595 [Candidatus Didemnitutus sp.]|nr:hypothetical protein [Candidatus Didemnitutus sp.]